MDNNINQDHTAIDELVWDEDFRLWVLTGNNELNEFWSNWIIAHQDRIEDVVAAKQIVKALAVKETPVSDAEVDIAIQNIFAKIDTKPDAEIIAIKQSNTNWFRYAGIAATFLLVASIALLFVSKYTNYFTVNYKDLVKASGNELVENTNTGTTAKEIILADGSKITLQKNSKISYPAKFISFSTRKVYLTGKATFEIAKNPLKPFFVYTNGLITRVVGTKFIITSNEADKNVTVEVISGIVSVFSLVDKKSQDYVNTKKLNSLILTRNQKANFSTEGRTLISSIVAQPIGLNEKVFDYAFSDESIKKIFKIIEANYGIEIIYDEKALANRTFTADLSKTTMYDKLNIICKSINARYEIIDGKVIVSANTIHNKE